MPLYPESFWFLKKLCYLVYNLLYCTQYHNNITSNKNMYICIDISYMIPEAVLLLFRNKFYIQLALPISPEIMDGFWCSRCLNDRIEVPDMMKLFLLFLFGNQEGSGTTFKWSYHVRKINVILQIPWTSKSVHYFRFYWLSKMWPNL